MNKTDQPYESGDRPATEFGGKLSVLKSGGFCFNSEDDAAHYFCKFEQEWGSFLIREGRSLVEAYAHGDVDIHLHVGIGAKHYGKFVIRCVPLIDEGNVARVDVHDGAVAESPAAGPANRCRKRLMNFTIAEFIHFPDEVSSALVRFEVKEVGANGFWDLGALSRQVVSRVSCRLPTREFGVFWLGLSAKSLRCVEDRVIQCGPQAIDDFKGEDSEFWGHWLDYSHLNDRLSGARIDVLGSEVRFAADIRFLSGIKFVDMMACARDK